MPVRRLATHEWERLRAIRLRAMADAPEAFLSTLAREEARTPEGWRSWLEPADEVACFVEETDGELIGLAATLLEGDAAQLLSMWVDPAHRRAGVGGRLVEAVVAWARDRGASRVELEVNETLSPAVALYERSGFAPTGARRPIPHAVADAVAMAKALR